MKKIRDVNIRVSCSFVSIPYDYPGDIMCKRERKTESICPNLHHQYDAFLMGKNLELLYKPYACSPKENGNYITI